MKVMAFVLSAALLAGASVAQAQTVETRQVATRDLDLSSPKDVKRLYGRIQSVAADMCQSAEGYPTVAEAERTCQREAVNETVARIHAPLLSELHTQKVYAQARKDVHLAEAPSQQAVRGK